MTRSASPRLAGYAALVATGLVAALALRRPELVALAAPFAAVLAAGLELARTPQLSVRLSLQRDRAVEGDELPAELIVSSETGVDRLEVVVALPPGVETARDNPVALRLLPGEERSLPCALRCVRWGAYTLGDVRVRARDRIGLFAWEERRAPGLPLKVYPRSERLRALVAPFETQVVAGNEVARAKGDGLEFADTRPFVPGDRVRAINWRATARRGTLVVNDRHPERNTDVILFLDSFAEARRPDGSTLDLAVRATATLAARYLDRRDRVGLVTFGGVLRWLVPASGAPQRRRLVDAVLETGIELSYAWKDVDVIPPRVLPPQALVLALTPLLDARSVGALLDLRARGHDLVVVEVSPVPFVDPGEGELDALAYRLWLLRRDELRTRFERAGVAVARWTDGAPLAAALEEVRTYRRRAPRARR